MQSEYKMKSIFEILPESQMPKKIIMELSDDGITYDAKLFIDVICDGEIRNGIISCKSRFPFNNELVVGNDKQLWNFTIPEDGDEKCQ